MSAITNKPNYNILSYFKGKVLNRIKGLIDELAVLIIDRSDAEECELTSKKNLRKELKKAYFTLNNQAVSPEEVLHTFDALDVQVNFVNQYNIRDQKHLIELLATLGPKHPLSKEITQKSYIVIDVSKMSGVEAEKLQAKIQSNYGVKSVLDNVPTVSKDFHNMRHVLLSVEDNLKLDEVLPVQVHFALKEP